MTRALLAVAGLSVAGLAIWTGLSSSQGTPYGRKQTFIEEAYAAAIDGTLREHGEATGWRQMDGIFYFRRRPPLLPNEEEVACTYPLSPGRLCRAATSTGGFHSPKECDAKRCVYVSVRPELWARADLRDLVVDTLRHRERVCALAAKGGPNPRADTKALDCGRPNHSAIKVVIEVRERSSFGCTPLGDSSHTMRCDKPPPPPITTFVLESIDRPPQS